MLNLLEQILGPEIAGHPTWNLRTKTPRSEAVNIPWHQGKEMHLSETSTCSGTKVRRVLKESTCLKLQQSLAPR